MHRVLPVRQHHALFQHHVAGLEAPHGQAHLDAEFAQDLGQFIGPVGVLLSPRMANEDLWLARRLFGEVLGVRHLDYRVPPARPGSHDDLLRVAAKAPNHQGAAWLGCGPADAADGRHVIDAVRAGRVRLLWVFDHDLLASGWPAAAKTWLRMDRS